jgi:hypothetical protein
MNQSATSYEALRRWRWPTLVGGVVLTAAGAAAALLDVAHFFRAYLVAWLFVWGLSLGSLVLVMVHHLTGGIWGLALRRPLEAQMRALPVVAVLFLPLLLGLKHIYPWASGDFVAHAFQRTYFETQYVALRWIGYLVLWLVPAWLLSRWSRETDRTAAAWPAQYAQNLSGPGLLVYGVSLHFAAIDWMMSIQPHFTSTIYGPIVAAGQLLSAFGVAVLVLAIVADAPEIRDSLSPPLLNDIGGLLMTLMIVWFYLIWFQFMLIWMADLRRDNVWYLERSSPAWLAVTICLALLGFVVPFFTLLFRSAKRNLNILAAMAALLLAMRWLYLEYQIMPAFGDTAIAWHLLEVVLSLGLGGIYLACSLWLLEQRPLSPVHDRNRSHARHLQHAHAEEHERKEALHHA